MPTEPSTNIIYAVSDATGDLAEDLADVVLKQFGSEQVIIMRRPKVTTPEKIDQIIREAKKTKGLILFTLVSEGNRKHLLQRSAEAGIMTIDVMGPLLETFTHFFHKAPSSQPGRQYQLTTDYFRRNEAVSFTIKHDDGLGAGTIHEADLVLLGISRTSKTPISIYLAFRGYKVANIPIVIDIPLPPEVMEIPRTKIMGLTISPFKLVELRKNRLDKIGRRFTKKYADLEAIREEIACSKQIFEKLGNIPVIDVTNKAIEEVASEILFLIPPS
ncbi:MAG: kinase/pyrophosphorylase [Deltaproteobacteria bacterium]|nr:kinase/pyrophosphorylase [Deltaproteobacteria bacterium]MBI2500667.1 kinase/pyrophosphorylase [Deltaproteobacteria bacterium]